MLARPHGAEGSEERGSGRHLAHSLACRPPIGCTCARWPCMCPRLVLHHFTVLANLHRALQPSIGHRQPARLYFGVGALFSHSNRR
jgi:hypothetical protein